MIQVQIGQSYGLTPLINDLTPWNHFQFVSTLGWPFQSNQHFDIVTKITDLYTVMAYAAESRSTALGTTPGVSRLANVSLQTIWPSPDPLGNSYKSHFWHSAEFRGDSTQERGYWSELLGSQAFNLQ
jgi:ribonucleotide reductase alpha subunit